MGHARFTPPRLLMRFFRFFCKPEYLEEIEGDLMEIYEEKSSSKSKAALKWLFAWEVFLLIRPKLLKSFVPKYLNPLFMLKDHVKISFRNLIRQKVYTVVNLTGLSLGIAASILLFLVVDHERSFDRFHEQAENIYKLGEQPPSGAPYYLTKIPLAPKLKADLPEVLLATRFIGWYNPWLETAHGRAQETIHYVDPDFAEIFSFPVMDGNLKHTLSSPEQIAISEHIALKLFGTGPAVGQQIKEIQGGKTWTVGAVLKDVPVNSSLQFELLTGWISMPEELRGPAETNWYDTFMNAYVLLDKNASPQMLSDKLDAIAHANFETEDGNTIAMLPMTGLRSEYSKNATIVNLLIVVAITILAIASVNYINLATAQSLARIKEVAVRKVLGSSRTNLVSQMLIEAFLVNSIATLVAWSMLYFAIPVLEERFSIELTLTQSAWWQLVFASIAFSGLLGLISGSLPALFITSVKPVTGLKGNAKSKSSSPLLRNGLLGFQFAASIFLLAGTLVVWKQIAFMKEQDLQFDVDQVVVVPVYSGNFVNGEEAFRSLKVRAAEYETVPEIEAVSFGQNVPGRYWQNYNNFADDAAPDNAHHLRQASVSSGYFETLGVKMLYGRAFDPTIKSDSAAVIINKAAMDKFGWKSIEGKKLCEGGAAGCTTYHVVGVTEDFHYQSLESAIEPTIHFLSLDYFNYMLVRFSPGKTQQVLARLENDYQALQPLQSFDYFFLDQEFADMYKSQERIGLSAGFFSLLAISIASLGLFSVTSFVIRRKRKEISIRKVMGANLWQLALLLTKHYVLLVLAAFLVAVPFAYWLLEDFLADFAYRISLSPFTFIIAGLVVMVFAVASISSIVSRAAKENPVLALRNE